MPLNNPFKWLSAMLKNNYGISINNVKICTMLTLNVVKRNIIWEFYKIQGLSKSCLIFFLLSRFNCGTGAAQIVSESPIVLGQWHIVTIYRDGMSGWLRMDNDTPISGRSQVLSLWHTHSILFINMSHKNSWASWDLTGFKIKVCLPTLQMRHILLSSILLLFF